MSGALAYVFLALPAVAIAWIVWSYRRKTGDKDARSREREAALIGLVRSGDPVPGPGAPETVSGASAARPAAAAPAKARERFLDPRETLVYLLLRTGLPAHEILARAPLSAVLAAAQAADRIPDGGVHHDLDFVVCDRSMRVVAVIQLAGRRAGTREAHIARGLDAAGIRLVVLDPGRLPRRDALAGLVLGPTGTGE